MKRLGNKILILPLLLAMLFLSGCSFLKSAHWDNNEYAAFVNVKTDAALLLDKCPNPKEVRAWLPILTSHGEYVFNYTKYLDENESTHAATIELRSLIQETKSRYDKGKVSLGYCKIKFQNIIDATDIILRGITKKVRK